MSSRNIVLSYIWELQRMRIPTCMSQESGRRDTPKAPLMQPPYVPWFLFLAKSYVDSHPYLRSPSHARLYARSETRWAKPRGDSGGGRASRAAERAGRLVGDPPQDKGLREQFTWASQVPKGPSTHTQGIYPKPQLRFLI